MPFDIAQLADVARATLHRLLAQIPNHRRTPKPLSLGLVLDQRLKSAVSLVTDVPSLRAEVPTASPNCMSCKSCVSSFSRPPLPLFGLLTICHLLTVAARSRSHLLCSQGVEKFYQLLPSKLDSPCTTLAYVIRAKYAPPRLLYCIEFRGSFG